MNEVKPNAAVAALLQARRNKGLERSLQDAALNQYAYWSAGSQFASRYLGPFDPTMSARDAWIKLDMVGKIRESAFPEWALGWNAAMNAVKGA